MQLKTKYSIDIRYIFLYTTLMKKLSDRFQINGQIWIQKGDKNFIGRGRVELLENIMLYGSISKAAKAMKMSHKAAWDSVDAMNNLSAKPMVKRVSGGKGGGGTVVTSYAKDVINAYKELRMICDNFFKTLGTSFDERLGDITSSDTVFSRIYGNISNISYNEENVEVDVKLDCSQSVTISTTKTFIEYHHLKINSRVEILVESNDIILMNKEVASSARNSLKGKVADIKETPGNAIITLDIGQGLSLKAHITTASLRKLSLKVGVKATALFKAFNATLFPVKPELCNRICHSGAYA